MRVALGRLIVLALALACLLQPLAAQDRALASGPGAAGPPPEYTAPAASTPAPAKTPAPEISADETAPPLPEAVPPSRVPPPRIDPSPPLSLLPTPDESLMDPRMAHSWATLPPRWFVATTFDVGFVYARPRVSFGYGRPFTQWIGVDANPVATSSGIGAYGGLRFALPFGDLRLGPRYFYAFSHTILPVKESYERIELESSAGTSSKTLTWEAELDVSIPLGPGIILARASASYVTGVSDDNAVFEETLRVIIRPPLVWRARGGYAFRFGAYNQHSIGIVLDVLDIPKRDDSVTLRLGPVMRFVLSRRVELRGSFVVTLTSPDNIGLVGGDFTELGVRYRWASE